MTLPVWSLTFITSKVFAFRLKETCWIHIAFLKWFLRHDHIPYCINAVIKCDLSFCNTSMREELTLISSFIRNNESTRELAAYVYRYNKCIKARSRLEPAWCSCWHLGVSGIAHYLLVGELFYICIFRKLMYLHSMNGVILNPVVEVWPICVCQCVKSWVSPKGGSGVATNGKQQTLL